MPPSIGMQGGGQHPGPPVGGGGGGPAKHKEDSDTINNETNKNFVLMIRLLRLKIQNKTESKTLPENYMLNMYICVFICSGAQKKQFTHTNQ